MPRSPFRIFAGPGKMKPRYCNWWFRQYFDRHLFSKATVPGATAIRRDLMSRRPVGTNEMLLQRIFIKRKTGYRYPVETGSNNRRIKNRTLLSVLELHEFSSSIT